jgi:hypothetical protein
MVSLPSIKNCRNFHVSCVIGLRFLVVIHNSYLLRLEMNASVEDWCREFIIAQESHNQND